MFKINIEQWVPKFILDDKNGYALAKAIEAALQYMNDKVEEGFNCLTNTDEMPEWRLDELAWEYCCPYDYSADITAKRRWIHDAEKLYSMYGTREAIYQYLAGYFDSVSLEEAWEYGGDPYHFRVLFSGGWDPDSVAWATKAIGTVKNVRSILDLYRFISKWTRNLYVGCAFYSEEKGTFQVAAVDMTGVDWYVDEFEEMLLDENGVLLIVEG